MNDIHHRIKDYKDVIFKIRRDLHRIPETAFKEKKTAAYLEQYLSGIDLGIEADIALTGIVSTMKTGRPGPTILFRADMDALPIAESTEPPLCFHP